MKNYSLLNLLRRSKVSSKEWITLNELKSFYKLPIIITKSEGVNSSLKLLNSRIVTLVENSGWSFAFLYLKETIRLTIRAISGQPEPLWNNSIPRVKRDHNGLPTVIPLSIRKILLDSSKDVGAVRATLCILSVFRVFKVPVKPKLDSIIEPFNGLASTFPYLRISKALNMLNLKAKFSNFRGFISESAGPNSKFSTWGATIDALAFLEHPKQFITFVRIAYISSSYFYLTLFIVINIIYGPIYILLRSCGMLAPLRMGKLSTVYDQAGKARIVAITNWWIQLALKPLHDSIFKSLKHLKTDGTFDQGAPLLRLYKERDPRYKFSCFDLSSATDRIPITLQVDILNALGVRGDLWSKLLDIPWAIPGELHKLSDEYVKNFLKSGSLYKVHNEQFVKYSVGQPMGAYSSWGMLAVTHHVIVQIAAVQCGFKVNTFNKYCVLGDDIVINNDRVANVYLQLMNTLGVQINSSKSIISYDVVEFAKRWLTPYGEISPLGPGNILNCSRNPGALGSLLYEAHTKGYFDNPGYVLNLLPKMPGTYSSHMALAMNTMFGLNGCFHPAGQLDTSVLSWCSYGLLNDPKVIQYSFYNGLLQALITELRDNLKTNIKLEEEFLRNSTRITGVNSKTLRFIELTSLLLNPGFYLYLLSTVKTEAEIQNELSYLFSNRPGSWNDIKEISLRSPQIIPALLKWGTRNDRKGAKDFGIFYRKLDSAIMQTASDLRLMTGADGTDFY
jgi:hypothetical protein